MMKHPHSTTPYTLEELKNLFEELQEAYFDDCDNLEESWYNFNLGTNKHTIYHWFEDQHVDFSVAKELGCS